MMHIHRDGGCFIILPVEFLSAVPCCEMVDARKYTRWARSQDRTELFISLIFLLCIGCFIMLLFPLPGGQLEAAMRKCSRTS